MTQPLIGFFVDQTIRIKDLLEANKLTLDIDSVFYGDQDLIPTGRTVCVHPGADHREMAGASNMTLNTLTSYILVYISKIADTSSNRLMADNLAKAIIQLLHNNLQLRDASGNNPILIHGFVSDSDPGYTIRGNNLFEAVRLTYQGTTKTRLAS